jgi:hypothetical protein
MTIAFHVAQRTLFGRQEHGFIVVRQGLQTNGSFRNTASDLAGDLNHWFRPYDRRPVNCHLCTRPDSAVVFPESLDSLGNSYCTAIGPPTKVNALEEMVAMGATFPFAPGANFRMVEPSRT